MSNLLILIRTLLCALVLILYALPTTRGYNASDLILNYPTAFTRYNKLLGMVLTYNLAHIDPLTLVIQEYVSMCEGGWQPTVVIFTVMPFSAKLRRYVRQRAFCYRIGDFVNITYSIHDPSIGISLAAEHRKYMSDKADLYDVFVYHEDDILFKYSHLTAYLNETLHLHTLLPNDGLHHNVIGFQRYRRIGFTGQGDQDIFEQEMLEEVPNFRPLCVKEKPYLLVEGNTHQAIWVFTKQQIALLNEKCGFLKQLSASREYMSSFSVFDRHLCGLNKLIPGDRFATFAIWHYYQGRHVSWISIFQSDENIRAGYHFSNNPRSRIDNIPSCWHPLVKLSLLEQNETVPDKLRRKVLEYNSVSNSVNGIYNNNDNIELNRYIENDSGFGVKVKMEYNAEFADRVAGRLPTMASVSPASQRGRKSGITSKKVEEAEAKYEAELTSIDALKIIWKNLKSSLFSIF